MMNNSGSHGLNEAPSNIGTSLHRPQSNTSIINHNFNDFSKYIQQTVATASGYYEAHNFHNFGQTSSNIPPLIHPFQSYQSIGHGSTSVSQNTQFSYENVMQNCLPSVSTTAPAEHHNIMLNFNQNVHSNTESELQTLPKKEFHPSSNNYLLNIPQVQPRIVEKSPGISKNISNVQNFSENVSTSSQNVLQDPVVSHNITFTEDTGLNKCPKLSPSSDIPSDNISKEPINDKGQYDNEIPRNLSQIKTETISENIKKPNESPTIQRTTYNIVKNNSIYKKCLTESKRKSLEKTVQLIESIIINSNSNNKSEVIDNNVDPLAFSPNPDFVNTNINENSQEFPTDSDDEVLIKKVSLKNKRKSTAKRLPPKKIDITHQSPVELSNELPNQLLTVKIEDIKEEPLNLSDIDYGNPFHRDSNGILSNNVGGERIVDMNNSVNEALTIIKNGSATNAYFECPHCSLLLQHPKRFLIHTKWHTFGLLNERRAELAKKREERTKARREAKLVLKLTPLAPGDESARRFPCKDCDCVFPTKSGLKNHRHKLHPVEVTECRVCLAPVRGAAELRDHMAVHEAAGLHQCPRCPKRFKYRHSLAKHADTHREKTHSCSECGKLFGSHALVRLHMKVHERAARGTTHRCTYCGKGFYEAYNLQVHERTHRNDKPFQCHICESRFVTNSSLKRHLKVSHGDSKPFMCEICKKCFASAPIRDRHELRAHADEDQFIYECKLCPKRYLKAKDLRSHTYKMHPKGRRKRARSDSS